MDFKIFFTTIVRQLLTGVGAFLVGYEVIPPELVASLLDSTTSLIVGGLMAASAYVWSLISKKLALDKFPVLK